MISAHSSPVTSRPIRWWLISAFWQKRHLRLQDETKIVPDPQLPESGVSSPKWGPALESSARRPVAQ